MGRLILIRHGESEGNRDRRFTTHDGVPLTEEGRTQAVRAAAWVAAAFAPVRIVSSPFLRARQTAAIIGERLGLDVDVEPGLHEQSYGALAGSPYEAIRTLYDPTAYWTWRPPGGETLVEVAVRAGAALDRVVVATPAHDVVVVSHGGVMQALWFHVTGAWRTAGVVRNAGAVVVEHRDGAWVGARAAAED